MGTLVQRCTNLTQLIPLDETSQLKKRLKEMLELEKHLKAERPELKPDCSLEEFTKMAWPVIEHDTPLIWGWYLTAICKHLEAVARGEIRNLIINIPPRFSKSTMVAVMFPVWLWTWKPGKKFLFASYGSDLSERDSLSCRRIIESNWFQTRYGKRFQLLKDRYTISKYETNQGGSRQASSVTGVLTGTGGDYVIVDDALKADDGNSKNRRDYVNRWWSETMSSRLNDQKTGCRVVIMQRLHEEDLTGYLLARESGYEHLCLPMEYEIARDPNGNPLPKHVTSIGFSDPRIEDGELLCPERIGPAEIKRLREVDFTEYAWAGQMQQRPSPRGGGLFRIDKIEIVSEIPNDARIIQVRAWDRAGTKDGGAYTAGALIAWNVLDNCYYIRDMVRGQWATDERERITKQTAELDTPIVRIILEQEPGSAGIDSITSTVRNLTSSRNGVRNYSIHSVKVTGDKITRADPMATQISVGNFKLVAGPWNRPLLQELEMFPSGKYKDQTDSISLGLNWLMNIKLAPQTAISSEPPQRFRVM